MIKFLYHDGLLNQSVAVFTHVLQDLVSSIVAGCGGGLGGHSQRVDQSLEVNNPTITHHWQYRSKLPQEMSSWFCFKLWNASSNVS